MKQFIKTNLKKIAVSGAIAAMITVVYGLLARGGIFILECAAEYLNPWQYFFDCVSFYGLHYLIVFSVSFFTVFYIMKMLKFFEQ